MNNVIKSILPFLLTLFLIGNLSSQSCNDPFQVTISNGNVTDLLNALNLSNANQLPSVSADVLIDGTFTIEQDLVVSDNINFLISDGS